MKGDIAQLAKILSERKDLHAVTVHTEAVASELYMCLVNSGVKIPDQLIITAFDDVKCSNLMKMPLTTYKRPNKDIARAAIEAMISRIRNIDQCPRKILLNGQLIIREST